MTLDQFHDLKVWHLRHRQDRPLEAVAWNMVLTLWLMGCVGTPAALLIGLGGTALAASTLAFLPGCYVAWRAHLHRTGRLRCDWMVALR